MKNNIEPFTDRYYHDISQFVQANLNLNKKFGVDSLKYILSDALHLLNRKLSEDIKHNKDVDDDYYTYKLLYLNVWNTIEDLYFQKFTSRQLLALHTLCKHNWTDATRPIELKDLVSKNLEGMMDSTRYDIPNKDVFLSFLKSIPKFLLYELFGFLDSFGEIIGNCVMDPVEFYNYPLDNVAEIFIGSRLSLNLDKHYYMVITCPTNTKLVARDSELVKNNWREFFMVDRDSAHFSAIYSELPQTIHEISREYPDDTFIVKYYFDQRFSANENCTIEYKNGYSRDIRITPEYIFYVQSDLRYYDKQEFEEFKKYLMQNINILDTTDEVKLTIERKDDSGNIYNDRKGYFSSASITWDNTCFRWTATKCGVCYIKVHVAVSNKGFYELIRNKQVSIADKESNMRYLMNS